MDIQQKLSEHLELTYQYQIDVFNQIKDTTDNNAILAIKKTGGMEQKQKEIRKEYAILEEFIKVATDYNDFMHMAIKWSMGIPTTVELRAKLKGINVNGGLIRRAVRDTNKLKQKAKREFLDIFQALWIEKLVIAAIVNLGDGLTALMIGSAEANPVYNVSPSLFAVFKLLYSCFFIWLGFYASNDTRFKKYISVTCLLYAVPMFSTGLITNVQALLNPEIIEASIKYTIAQKTSFYTKIVLIPGMVIMAKDFLLFKLYDSWLKKDGDVK
jgi:hypothetical protein